MNEPSLRLLEKMPGPGHGGEAYAVAFSSDSAFVLSGGWDGQLLLWETGSGNQVSSLRVGQKPLSACAFGPANRTLLAGSMEGILTIWDAASHQLQASHLAHIRPISAIRYSPDGNWLITASWDKQVALRSARAERDATVMYGHTDIVAGTAFTPDGKSLFTWSHDGSAILWDVEERRQIWVTERHDDRLQGGAISPDGHWAVTASRDGELRLWDLATRTQAGSLGVQGEVRGCWFLLDAESVVIATADGWLAVLAAPDFQVRAEMLTGLKVECGEMAPSGAQLALGCGDGHVRLIQFEGLEQSFLVVTATQSIQRTATLLDRVLGKTRAVRVYQYSCPVCQHAVETPHLPAEPVPCPQCKQPLRINTHVRVLQGQ